MTAAYVIGTAENRSGWVLSWAVALARLEQLHQLPALQAQHSDVQRAIDRLYAHLAREGLQVLELTRSAKRRRRTMRGASPQRQRRTSRSWANGRRGGR